MATYLLSIVLGFIFVAGIVIFVHELGHFLVARLLGVKVQTFSLGFGQRLWGFRRGETDYRVSVIPLGGYVSFVGHEPGAVSDDPGAFVNHPRWHRILILLAGPAMNVLLSLLLVAGVFMAGTEIPNRRDLSTEIGGVLQDSPAERAGLQEGDRILAIDGKPMEDWQAVDLTLLTSPDRELEVAFEREGERQVTKLTPARTPKDDLGEAGVIPAAPWRINTVNPDSPAERAGFRHADIPLAVNGHRISSIDEFIDAVSARPGQKVVFTVRRLDQVLELTGVPEDQDGKGVLGVSLGRFSYQRYGPIEALVQSVRYNLDITREMGAFLGKVFEHRISAKSAIGGPIQIARVSGEAARAGFKQLIMLVAIISLNLFLLNMLPIPILDGGQLLILAVEGVLRRDLSLRIKERMIQVGLVLIVLLMAMAIYFDISKV